MATAKQKHPLHPKIMRKESKHTTGESHQTSKEERAREKRDRGLQNSRDTTKNSSEYMPINNYFKCK